jgi:hypothetical protein
MKKKGKFESRSIVYLFGCLLYLFMYCLYSLFLRGHSGRDRIVFYNYMYNQCLSPLTTKVLSSNPAHGEVYSIKTLCNKVYQWFVTGTWFSLGTPVFPTNKTDRDVITEISLTKESNIIILSLVHSLTID